MAPRHKYSEAAYARRKKKAKEYQKNNPSKAWHNRYIAKTYKVTKEQYDAMLAQQGGVCAICKGLPDRTFYCVDHCHKTGKIRGLLCHKCNSGLGMFQENIDNIRSAVSYLEKNG